MIDERMFRAALIGGVLLGVLSVLPVISAFNCLCCAWVIVGGVLAAHLYVKSAPAVVTLGQGVGLGLLTGVIGAIVDTLFSIPLHFLLSRIGMGFMEQFGQIFEQVQNLPPETREAMRAIVASGGSAGTLFILLSGLIKVVIYGLVAMLGGAIGVAIFEKRKIGAADLPPQAPYEPPPEPPREQ